MHPEIPSSASLLMPMATPRAELVRYNMPTKATITEAIH